MTLTIELSETEEAVLKARAARLGLTLEDWIKKLAADDVSTDFDPDPHPLRTAADIVLRAMSGLPPEAFASLPKDGASEHDHYLYGHPKHDP